LPPNHLRIVGLTILRANLDDQGRQWDDCAGGSADLTATSFTPTAVFAQAAGSPLKTGSNSLVIFAQTIGTPIAALVVIALALAAAVGKVSWGRVEPGQPLELTPTCAREERAPELREPDRDYHATTRSKRGGPRNTRSRFDPKMVTS
jgi:hypothetical protein